MPRYRISFSREWTIGRWGFLDRFFHDLGGRESEPSKLANAWVVDYRGNARRLGRELAAALNIQESDFQKFGPIFDIEELTSEPVRPTRPRESEPAADRAPPEPAGQQPAEPPPAAPPSGPTWVQSADVEDIVLERASSDSDDEIDSSSDSEDTSEMDSATAKARVSSARVRRDDLFRIRKTNRTLARHRADAITGAARRKPPIDRSPLE